MQQNHDDDDDEVKEEKGTWVRKHGFPSEFSVDARWVLYFSGKSKPQGSLRIVSHPDLRPGHLKSFITMVTKRTPKSKEELEAQAVDRCGIKYPIYGITQDEMEIYSVDENVEVWENSIIDTHKNLEKLYGVKIFE